MQIANAGTTFASIRLRLLGWAARRFAGKAGEVSVSGTLSKLPDSSLFPLFRNGLDPVAEVGNLREQSPVSRLPVPLGVSLAIHRCVCETWRSGFIDGAPLPAAATWCAG